MSEQEIPITMTVRPLGRQTDRAGWEHTAWECSLYYEEDAREQRSMTVTFRMGVAHGGVPPAERQVLESLLDDAQSVDDSRSFEEWASDLGYDPDSRKDERAYRACVAQTKQLRRLLGPRYEELLYAERDS